MNIRLRNIYFYFCVVKIIQKTSQKQLDTSPTITNPLFGHLSQCLHKQNFDKSVLTLPLSEFILQLISPKVESLTIFSSFLLK